MSHHRKQPLHVYVHDETDERNGDTPRHTHTDNGSVHKTIHRHTATGATYEGYMHGCACACTRAANLSGSF